MINRPSGRRETFRVTVNGRACERISFSSGEVRYFAQARDVRFPTFRLVPASQKHFRRKIDEAINAAAI